MQRKSFHLALAGLAISAAGFAGATALHAAEATGRERHLGTLREQVKMTPEQRREVRAVLVAHRDELADVARPLVESARALREATLAETPDDATIRAAADQLGKSLGDAAVLAAKLKPELKGLLTTAQIEAIMDLRESTELRVDAFLDRLENAGR